MPAEALNIKKTLNKPGASITTETPDSLMTEITELTLHPYTWVKNNLHYKCKTFWLSTVLLTAVGTTFAFAPKTATTLAINLIRWRSSVFFLYSSFELAALIHKKVYGEDNIIRNPWPCLRVITSMLNWIGFGTAIAGFVVATFTTLITLVPLLSFAMGGAFALSELSNMYFEYKADSDLINSVMQTHGEHKQSALNYLHTRRSMNLVFNCLKTTTYIAFAAVSLMLLTNPLAPMIATGLALGYFALFFIQKGMQMIQASNYKQHILFADTQEAKLKTDEPEQKMLLQN